MSLHCMHCLTHTNCLVCFPPYCKHTTPRTAETQLSYWLKEGVVPSFRHPVHSDHPKSLQTFFLEVILTDNSSPLSLEGSQTQCGHGVPPSPCIAKAQGVRFFALTSLQQMNIMNNRINTSYRDIHVKPGQSSRA